MNKWSSFPDDDEFERADDLIDQADALLRRHRGTDAPAPNVPHEPAHERFDDDELPILTEVVEDFEPPAGWRPAEAMPQPAAEPEHIEPLAAPLRWEDLAPPTVKAQPAPSASFATPAPSTQGPDPVLDAVFPDSPPAGTPPLPDLTERLVDLDTTIAREISRWVEAELPQLVSRELDRVRRQLEIEVQSHLRATLLPEISARISALLDQNSDDTPPPRA